MVRFMASEVNYYSGADYGFEPRYPDEFSLQFEKPVVAAGQFGIPTDPRTANQLKAVSDKLNTGAKTIEISAINQTTLDSIPRQHLDEIRRLKAITGSDMTFHGPMVEASGLGQGGWDPTQREAAERQVWNAVERAHQLTTRDEKGKPLPNENIVVTFHASVAGPEPRTRVKTADGKEITSALAVIDERTGRFGALPREGKDYLFKDKEQTLDDELTRFNKRQWNAELSNVNFSLRRGDEIFRLVKKETEKLGEEKIDPFSLLKATPEQLKKELEPLSPDAKKDVQNLLNEFNYAEAVIRSSYTDFQNMYNQAYSVAEKNKDEEMKRKLDKLREEIVPVINEYEKDVEKKGYQRDPDKVTRLSEAVSAGLQVLDSLPPPQTFKPLDEFVIDKASDTFSNVAFKAFKEFGSHAPIISLENHPAGMGGITRAEELRKVIVESRSKFAQKLKDEGFSEKEAEKQAEKLIGATWDVGHINMIRKFGYTAEDTVKEAEKIAPYVKHVHLSDNFGLDHTELPMGMGNVEMKKIMELRKGFEKAKKVIETGNWFGPQGFSNQTPLRESLRAFGSPVYSMAMGPYWSGTANTSGGYFGGYGQMLPEQHFNMYGAGFSMLPPELGGQMSGRNRLSGNQMD